MARPVRPRGTLPTNLAKALEVRGTRATATRGLNAPNIAAARQRLARLTAGGPHETPVVVKGPEAQTLRMLLRRPNAEETTGLSLIHGATGISAELVFTLQQVKNSIETIERFLTAVRALDTADDTAEADVEYEAVPDLPYILIRLETQLSELKGEQRKLLNQIEYERSRQAASRRVREMAASLPGLGLEINLPEIVVAGVGVFSTASLDRILEISATIVEIIKLTLTHQQTPEPAYIVSVQTLGELGTTAANEILVEALNTNLDLTEPSTDKLEAIIFALGNAGVTEAAPKLRDLIQDDKIEWSLQAAAIQALGMMGDPEAVNLLAPNLLSLNSEIREVSALAMAMIGTENAVHALIVAARDLEDPWHSQQAIEALALADSDQGREVLRSLVISNDAVRSRTAAEALGASQDPINTMLLFKLLADSLPSASFSGSEILAVNVINALALLYTNPRIPGRLAYLLKTGRNYEKLKISKAAQDALVNLANNGTPEVRDAVIEALSETLSRNGELQDVRTDAMITLERIGGNRVIKIARQFVPDSNAKVKEIAERLVADGN